MKLKFIQTLATTDQCYRKGHEYFVDDKEASSLLAHGIAEGIIEQPQPKKTSKKTEQPGGIKE